MKKKYSVFFFFGVIVHGFFKLQFNFFFIMFFNYFG